MKADDFSSSDQERFWSKVAKTGPDDCWIWTGWKTAQGYGRFDFGRRKVLAPQMSLILDGRPRPPAPNDYALHGDCSNPSCVNPAHLRWGTHQENMDDMNGLGRNGQPSGEENGNSKITEEVVRFIRSSQMTQVELGKLFGLSRIWVGMIKRRQVWKHLP